MPRIEQILSSRLLHSSDTQAAKPIVRLSVIAIALCITIITLALSITLGYRHAIEQKVIDMGSHIRVSNYDLNYTFDPKPIDKNQFFLQELHSNPDIASIQYFSTKVGIIKTADQVEGVVFKGIDSTFSWEHFQRNLIAGKGISLCDSQAASGVVLSTAVARKLKLSLGDNVYAYFVQDPPMQRKFVVEGLYETGLPEYDKQFVFADLRHLQKISGWSASEVGGIEILINDYSKIDQVGQYVNDRIGYHLKAETIKQIYPSIFQWTALFDTNVAVLLCITIFICIVSLISTFFIIILEQTSTIGILQTLGLTTPRVRRIFIYLGGRIVVRGMIWGNILGIGLCLLQQLFHIVKLDAASYYVSYVPVELNIALLVAVNVGVLLLCMLVLLIPTTYISKRISPITAIRFE